MKQEGFEICYEEVITGHNFPISFLRLLEFWIG